jgi:hypothetical protein
MDPKMVEYLPAWISALATVAAVAVAYFQLKQANKQLAGLDKQLQGLDASLRMNGLMAVLQIESDMHSRMHRMVEIGTRIELEKNKANKNLKNLASLQRNHGACIEHYLNAADRLAFCIRHEYVPDKDWRAEYRSFFSNIITAHKEFYFGSDSIYTNIIDLDAKWKRE